MATHTLTRAHTHTDTQVLDTPTLDMPRRPLAVTLQGRVLTPEPRAHVMPGALWPADGRAPHWTPACGTGLTHFPAAWPEKNPQERRRRPPGERAFQTDHTQHQHVPGGVVTVRGGSFCV